MGDYVQVKCRHCDKTTQFSVNALQLEIQRLRTYNFEILPCQHCTRKFSRDDFERAVGIGRFQEISKDMKCTIKDIPDTLTSEELIDYNNEQITFLAKKQEEERLKKEEEIKKMQSGEPFDEKLVGPVEMEEGTPQDRRCVRILKKEGEIYAYTFNAIDYVISNVWEVIRSIGHAIWDLIRKINWCIVCSALRIGYFIGYIGLIIYGLIATFVLHEAIFNNNYLNFLKQFQNCTLPYHLWTFSIILICIVPLGVQLSWAFSTPDSRWAKVIKKRADEIIK
jgi:hypothetical protein